MRRPTWSIALTAPVLLLCACGSSSEDGKLAQSRMDDLESLKGTISDDMINTDEATDQAPLDPAPTAAPPKQPDDPGPATEPAEPTKTPDPDFRIEPEPAAE
jgi:hypothetical protein